MFLYDSQRVAAVTAKVYDYVTDKKSQNWEIISDRTEEKKKKWRKRKRVRLTERMRMRMRERERERERESEG